jgi:hypothetical protein
LGAGIRRRFPTSAAVQHQDPDGSRLKTAHAENLIHAGWSW